MFQQGSAYKDLNYNATTLLYMVATMSAVESEQEEGKKGGREPRSGGCSIIQHGTPAEPSIKRERERERRIHSSKLDSYSTRT